MSEVDEAVDREWFRRPSSFRYRLVRLLSNLFRGRIKSPLFYRHVDMHQRNEFQPADQHQIGTDEHVQIWSLWTVEFYTPDNINRMYDALDCIDSEEVCADRRLGAWLRRQRSNAGSGRYFNLVSPKKQGLPGSYCCALPEFATRASCTIQCVTPSLTVLITHFEMKESERLWLNDELHRVHPARIMQESDGSVSTSFPSSVKKQLVHEKRKSWVSQATAWHLATFPGLLSSHDEQVSACELSTLEGVEPLANESLHNNLLSALGLDSQFSVFEGPAGNDSNLFRLRLGNGFRSSLEMMLLSATNAQFRSQGVSSYASGDGAYLARTNEIFRHTFAAAALPRVLRFYSRRAALARDGAAQIIGSTRVLKALTSVRSYTAQCNDASIVARELRDAVVNENLHFHGAEFTRRKDQSGQDSGKLSKAVCDELKWRADSLLVDVETLNEILHAQASLLSAHANLKLQPWIILLALLSLGATIASTIVR